MQELIRIENREGKETVNARELFDFLEYDKSQWSRWSKSNISECDIFQKNIDWIGFDIMSNGNTTVNYYITIDMAKELSMLARNDKGRQARQYFIECEKRLNQPLSLEEMTLKVITGMTEKVKQLESKIETDKPKVDFYNAVTGSSNTIDMSDVAKVLNISGYGRNKIFDILREKSILNTVNKPYQKYVDLGYFRLIETSYTKPDGSTHLNIKTVVYQKGLDFIRKILNDVK